MTKNLRHVPVSKPFVVDKAEESVRETVASAQLSGKSPKIIEFEEAFCDVVGQRHGAAVSSGTAALHLALLSIGVEAGDEVIVPDFVMAAPLFAIAYCGATPIFVDADRSWNIDSGGIRRAITTRTRAILVVHTYGHPADMEAISRIAEEAGLPIIEDGAEALGASARGKMVGSFGSVACFSFYSNKAITTGEGGMVVTSSQTIIDRVRSLRDMCFGSSSSTRFLHERLGFNYRMSAMQAALGLTQLPHLNVSVESSRENARLYRLALADIRHLTLPPDMSWASSSYWAFGIIVDKQFGSTRDRLCKFLAESDIECRPFFQPAHRQPFLKALNRSDSEFPQSAKLADEGLYLPSFLGLQGSDIERIASTIRAAAAPGS